VARKWRFSLAWNPPLITLFKVGQPHHKGIVWALLFLMLVFPEFLGKVIDAIIYVSVFLLATHMIETANFTVFITSLYNQDTSVSIVNRLWPGRPGFASQ